MSVRTFCAALGSAAVVASGLAAFAVAPAQADPASTPSATDYVGVGSDTTQFVVSDLINGKTVNGTAVPGYNAGVASGSPQMASFDACTVPTGKMYPCTPGSATDATTYITLRTGTTPIPRPNGSGAGKNLLHGSTDNPAVTFARSSGGLSSAEVSDGLVAYPFAVDTLVVVTSPNSNAPATISGQDLLKIYNGTYTNWNQVPGGKSGVINPLKPQSGSGTLSFFQSQLTTLNGGTAVTDVAKDHELADSSGKPCSTASATCVDTKVQEHDPTLLTNDPNAIAPFSLGRANLANQAGSSPAVTVEKGFSAQRALYNVLRSKDAGTGKDVPDWFAGAPAMDKIFGSSGFLCSAAARPIIEADGFKQLKSLSDGGSCGTRVTTTSAPALDVYNATPTATVSGRVTGTSFGSTHTVTVAVTGSNPSAKPTGNVTVTVGTQTPVTGAVGSDGTFTAEFSSTLPAGSYNAQVSYDGDANYASSSTTVPFTVSKAATATTATFKGTLKKGTKKVAGTVSVVSKVGAVSGPVKITKGGKTLASGNVSNGKAKLTISASKLKKGKNKLVAFYSGSTNLSSSSKAFTIVKK